ncbi:cholinesterase 1 isoform X1 [Helicoverpa armigera]|uniref:cholinesterase 1 isoform X1 n=1 Tax=Helicoverpa armigera TaxID=29058 RepID=UPI003083C4C4
MKWWTCVVFACAAVLADDEWREVRTAQGPVRGRKHPTADIYTFYNIPYATAPTGEDKFKAPLPPPVWLEPFDAVDEHVICPQPMFPGDLMPTNVVTKENCLIANVFVPNTKEKNLSVVVYVHGGAFIMGWGEMFKARQFMKTKDFIVVTFNYRLGIHGFLCLGTEDAPGNAGMKDQVALLRWVQKNIASFGGNPDDVTIAGYSAGSASVDLLMLSKSAEGLFHRVIPESGGNLAAFSIQRDPVEIAKSYASKLGFDNGDDIYALGKFYMTAPIEKLTSDPFFDRTDSTFLFAPCVERETGDGAFLTESPLTILKTGNYRKLPVLYGFAEMEGLIRIDFFELWKHKMNEKFSDFLPADLKFDSEEEREEVANKIKEFYFGDKPVGNENILKYVDFFSDVIFAYPMLWAVKLHVEAGNNQVYLYEYSFVDEDVPVVPHTNIRGANHCAQTMALSDGKNFTHHDDTLATPQFREMKKTIREIWHNFVKTGVPVPEGSWLPAWPAAGADRAPHMSLGERLELRGALLAERTRFWDDIYQRYYRDAVPPPKPPPRPRNEL